MMVTFTFVWLGLLIISPQSPPQASSTITCQLPLYLPRFFILKMCMRKWDLRGNRNHKNRSATFAKLASTTSQRCCGIASHEDINCWNIDGNLPCYRLQRIHTTLSMLQLITILRMLDLLM